MDKLKAIKKLVDGHKLRKKKWIPKTKHLFMEEDGMIILAQEINDPDAMPFDLNCETAEDWEILKDA
jgi:hypothetical protein